MERIENIFKNFNKNIINCYLEYLNEFECKNKRNVIRRKYYKELDIRNKSNIRRYDNYCDKLKTITYDLRLFKDKLNIIDNVIDNSNIVNNDYEINLNNIIVDYLGNDKNYKLSSCNECKEQDLFNGNNFVLIETFNELTDFYESEFLCINCIDNEKNSEIYEYNYTDINYFDGVNNLVEMNYYGEKDHIIKCNKECGYKYLLYEKENIIFDNDNIRMCKLCEEIICCGECSEYDTYGNVMCMDCVEGEYENLNDTIIINRRNIIENMIMNEDDMNIEVKRLINEYSLKRINKNDCINSIVIGGLVDNVIELRYVLKWTE